MRDVDTGPGSPLRRTARREWGPLLVPVWDELKRGKWRAIPMTLSCVCLTLGFQIWQNAGGLAQVERIGAVYAGLSWQEALLRTPLSLFVPAPDLPVWGALAQVLIVFGICEIRLGRLKTLLIAYACTLAGTMYARYGAAVGPDGFLGLPAETLTVRDTGPSAAVVSLAVFVCWRYRAWLTGALVILAMIIEVIVKPNLAGKEHLAALVLAVILWAVSELWRKRREGRGRRERRDLADQSRSGAPASTS
ncbi:hypothetical protein [Streptomyces gobiensis]|uniref:hypothetical protein n=1 Tax=Streptomyces gobiensis TaxID=2875706 RepID=UPI001E31D12D|nr:hypothetical protein [Streptomyces gobiensis]UGY90972.1 hypothetical protein test1122_04005 [Streptomyces gobiensis]